VSVRGGSALEPSASLRARRVFSEEFRAGAVRLVLEEGKSADAVARDLVLSESAAEASLPSSHCLFDQPLPVSALE
jgi:transposase-like protein